MSETTLIYDGQFEADDCGIKKIRFIPQTEGTLSIRAGDESGCLSGVSNPGICRREECAVRHYWGDLHGHTGIQWGRGSGRSYYEFAREAAAIDFCALTDPDAGRYTNDNKTARLSLSCYMTERQWKEIQEVNKAFYEEAGLFPYSAMSIIMMLRTRSSEGIGMFIMSLMMNLSGAVSMREASARKNCGPS